MTLLQIEHQNRKLQSAVRALLPCALIAAEMLAAIDKGTEAKKILQVHNLAQQFLEDAQVRQ